MPWELLFVDDLVLVAESIGELKEKVLRWKEHMKIKGLKINTSKTKIIVSVLLRCEKVHFIQLNMHLCARYVRTVDQHTVRHGSRKLYVSKQSWKVLLSRKYAEWRS